LYITYTKDKSEEWKKNVLVEVSKSDRCTCLWASCSLRLRRARSGEARVSWTLSMDRCRLFTSLSSLPRSYTEKDTQ